MEQWSTGAWGHGAWHEDEMPHGKLSSAGHQAVLGMGRRVGGKDSSNADVLAVLDILWSWIDEETKDPELGDLCIDLIFDVPGPLYPYDDYQGARTGRLSRVKRLLQIQVAVPKDLNTADAWAFTEDALVSVYNIAKEYSEDHRLGYSVEALKDVTARVLQRIKNRLQS